MYPVSEQYKQTVENKAREWDLYIDISFLDGRNLRLTKKDISLNTAILKEGATCSSTIQIGSTYSNSFEFSILNRDNRYTEYDFYKAKIQPYVGLLLQDSTYEYVPLGEFWILEGAKKLSTIPIIGFDQMSLTNQVFDFSEMQFPTNVITIFDAIASQCSINPSDSLRREILQLDYSINSLLTNDPTCRDILAGIGIMLQKNLRFNRLGILESFWYEDAQKRTSKSTRVGNSSYSDYVAQITGVYLEDAYGNTFSVGTGEYPVELPTSPIIQGSEMSETLLSASLHTLQSITHRQSTVTYSGDPSVQAGDIITHIDTSVGTVTNPVMSLIYKFSGTSTLECVAPNVATQIQSTSTDRKLKNVFAKTNKDRAELETRISQTSNDIVLQVNKLYRTNEGAINDLSAQLKVFAEGITARIISDMTSSDEWSELLQSILDLSITSEGLNIEISTTKQSVENFLEQFLTYFQFTAQGLLIGMSGSEFDTMLSNTKLSFRQAGVEIAYIQYNRLYITEAWVKDGLSIGSPDIGSSVRHYVDGSQTYCIQIIGV